MNARPLSLKGRALRFLAAREHSRTELERKLAPHAADQPGELARVLDLLEAKGLLSQQRFVDSVVHRRAPRHGSARIRQELQAKGVDAEAIATALAGLKRSEAERARLVWQQRFGGAPADAAARAKQMRFLLARGFAADVAHQVVQADGDVDEPQPPPAD